MDIDRRAFLQLAGLSTLTFVAACSPGSSSSKPTPTSGGGAAGGSAGDAFASPADMRSVGGTLDVTLVAAATMVPWGGGTRYALTYNGTTPGPTLRVRPGDTVRVTLQNRLDKPTNLHTHGLHVSPSGDSDNVFVMVDPGMDHTYTYRIPADHPSGTFWYHPHHHGYVAAQLSGGMAGVIVVDDGIDALPAMSTTVERTMVISDPSVGASASVLQVSNMQQMFGREGDVVLVNGQLRPVLTSVAGSVERWRLVNASASRYYRLVLQGASMSLIASDHGRLAAPKAIDSLLLTPGQRAEVLVPLSTVGTLTLATEAVSRSGMGGGGMGGGMGGGGMGGGAGGLSGAADIVTVKVAAGSGNAMLPTSLRALDDPTGWQIDRTRSLQLGSMGMGMSASMFTIDGKAFDGARIDQHVTLGATEDWTITNRSMMDHPFHLHVWPMWVLDRSDGSEPDPGWRDTVNVPAGQSVTVRIRFVDFAGTAVYHCHILDHEDLGMMGIIQVA